MILRSPYERSEQLSHQGWRQLCPSASWGTPRASLRKRLCEESVRDQVTLRVKLTFPAGISIIIF